MTKLSLRAMPAAASKMDEWESPLKSQETTYEKNSKTEMYSLATFLRGSPAHEFKTIQHVHSLCK